MLAPDRPHHCISVAIKASWIRCWSYANIGKKLLKIKNQGCEHRDNHAFF